MSVRTVGNLPVEMTSFVGRREDLTHAKNLLASARLLTLTGMGGVGKTRFALRLAGEIRRNFSDGVWLVELADLRQGELLAQTISSVLGLRDESTDPVGFLTEHLRERRLLLILDNCEHLTTACAELITRLLRSAPALKILATSRHILGVEGEQVFPVPPLSQESATGLSEAMLLFEERASAADPRFRITDDNREAVARISRALEGLPLAVELAAANVRTFSPAEIAERLQDSELLTATEQTRPSRHRTLDAAVDWSYGLCTPHERHVWEQLAIFSGGFTVETADGVCLPFDPGSSVVGALIGLVDKSIIIRIKSSHGTQGRYRMLQPVRQFAMEKLALSPDAPDVKRRHRDYFLRLARRGISDYCSSRDVEWYSTTQTEQANIREALAFSLSDPAEPLIALAMATALRPFWEQSGSVLEGYHWLRRILDRVVEPSPERATGLVAASILAFLVEQTEDARTLLREYRELTAQQPSDELAVTALFASALEASADDDIQKAFEQAEKAVELGIDRENPGLVAEAMALSALFAFITEHEHAEHIALRFVHFTERHDAHLLKAIALYPLGAVRWRKGDVASATALMSEAIRLYQMFEHPGMVAVCIEGLAWSAAASKPDRAALLLGAAKSIWQYSQMRLAQAAVQQVTSIVEAELRQKLGNHTFEQIHDKGQELSFEESVALALGSETDREPKGKGSSTRAGLTRREQQIAALVADGLTNREIATKLVISQRTVDAHVEHIRTKLGFRSRTQIVRWLDTAERPD
ncbi:MAG: LuxR family transcriptional regulator [Rhodococcus sp. (in: high G+C Gram-positive bacteria)]|nr:MAG: LuxR family transcriptional regulator [Rhodococcus sp. (in: high G+C Gram-positive bacteria)]